MTTTVTMTKIGEVNNSGDGESDNAGDSNNNGNDEGDVEGDTDGNADAGALDTERPAEAHQGCQDLSGLGVSGEATLS